MKVEVVKQTGDVVTLHTAKLRLREMGRDLISQDTTLMPYSLVEDQVPIEEQWITMIDIPMQMASISRYQTGTSILRSGSCSFGALSGINMSHVMLSISGQVDLRW